MDVIKKRLFGEINLEDEFFDTLKEDYPGFDKWFNKKVEKEEYAFVLDDKGIQGFLYLKEENEKCTDIMPNLEAGRRLKVGTFKINAHGTKLGERFIKIIIDEMFKNNFNETYVTIFEKHDSLIKLLEKYGFVYYGKKESSAGKENVYIKYLKRIHEDILLDYPKVNINNNNKFLLAIFPKFHTRMFPDSKLKTEKTHRIEDISFTNSIEKIYLSGVDLSCYRKGDIIVIYRTKDYDKPARYSSVATSICVVEEIKHINSFNNYDEFYNYCIKHSVFTEDELKYFWDTKRYEYLIKMLYNVALDKRPIRRDLIEKVGLDGRKRWAAVDLTDEEFLKILELGDVSESFIID